MPTLTSGSGPSAARERKCVCAFLFAELFYFSPNKVKFPLFQSFIAQLIANDKIAYFTCSKQSYRSSEFPLLLKITSNIM